MHRQYHRGPWTVDQPSVGWCKQVSMDIMLNAIVHQMAWLTTENLLIDIVAKQHVFLVSRYLEIHLEQAYSINKAIKSN